MGNSSKNGPYGLGDPNDKKLRKVEIEVLIPKKMRDIARADKCKEEVSRFSECCGISGFSMVFKCRTENSNLKKCLTKWYDDENFREHCKNLYLEERSEFRRTGISTKKRLERIASFA